MNVSNNECINVPEIIRVNNNDIINMIHDCLIQFCDDGATTREVSEYCDISVYSARHWLMKLQEAEIVSATKSGGRINKWFLL